MVTQPTIKPASRPSRAPLMALVAAGAAAVAILAGVAVANWWPEDGTAASVTSETPVAAPLVVNEGVSPRGGLAEAIQERQVVNEGVAPRGGLAEAIQEQQAPSVPASCGPAELAGIC